VAAWDGVEPPTRGFSGRPKPHDQRQPMRANAGRFPGQFSILEDPLARVWPLLLRGKSGQVESAVQPGRTRSRSERQRPSCSQLRNGALSMSSSAMGSAYDAGKVETRRVPTPAAGIGLRESRETAGVHTRAAVPSCEVSRPLGCRGGWWPGTELNRRHADFQVSERHRTKRGQTSPTAP
jgi:hypothetical protein